jgi:hypothetical protein
MVKAAPLGTDTSVTSQGHGDDASVAVGKGGEEISKCYEFNLNERLHTQSPDINSSYLFT